MCGTGRGTGGPDLGTEGGAGAAGASLLHGSRGPELLALPPLASRQCPRPPHLHPRNRARSCHICGTCSPLEGCIGPRGSAPLVVGHYPCQNGVTSILVVTWPLRSHPTPSHSLALRLKSVQGLSAPFLRHVIITWGYTLCTSHVAGNVLALADSFPLLSSAVSCRRSLTSVL